MTDNIRKLASVQIINNISPIEGYDRVELATVLGWSCIVKKDDFKVGDKCVYFEPDSQLYPCPVWDVFMEKRKWKVKTLKMCKTISQGLVLPLSVVNELANHLKKETLVLDNLEEGYDLTEYLNIEHIEKGNIVKYNSGSNNNTPKNPLVKYMFKYKWFRKLYKFLMGHKPKGQYPTEIISKTDETNIQAIPSILQVNGGKTFYISEKLEGQNGNYILFGKTGFLNKLFKRNEFMVMSHNVKLPHDDGKGSWWKIAKQYDIENKLNAFYKETGIHIGIQGEIIGEGIQKNIYKIKGFDFYIFNVKNLDTGEYFNLKQKQAFCDKVGLKLVPIIAESVIIDETMTPQSLLEMSNGKSTLNENTMREGFVIRSIDNDRISFKVRSPEYLLKN